MSRWSPDAEDRLVDAALELFAARGYAETTVAEVAAHAGLTYRTFFRYFADKKEVLFPDNTLVETIGTATAASTSTSPLGRAVAGLRAVCAEIQTDPARVRRRAAVIATTPELKEREMLKISQWTEAAADALIGQGVDPRAARVVAEVATALFRVAYADWTAGAAETSLVSMLDDLVELHDSVATHALRTGVDGMPPERRSGDGQAADPAPKVRR